MDGGWKQETCTPGAGFASGAAWVSAAALFFLMAMTFADVISRSVFSAPFGFSAELTELSMAVIVFSALPLATLKDGHIEVDLLDRLYSPRMAAVRDTLVDLLCCAALAYPAWRVWQLGLRSKSYGEVTEILRLPQYWMICFVSVVLLGASAAYLLRILVRLRGQKDGAGPC